MSNVKLRSLFKFLNSSPKSTTIDGTPYNRVHNLLHNNFRVISILFCVKLLDELLSAQNSVVIIFLTIYVILWIYLPITVFNIRLQQLNVSSNCKYKTLRIVIWEIPYLPTMWKNTTFMAISAHTNLADNLTK